MLIYKSYSIYTGHFKLYNGEKGSKMNKIIVTKTELEEVQMNSEIKICENTRYENRTYD